MISGINTGQGCPEAYLPWNRGGNMQSVWRKVWFKFCWNMRSFFGNAQFFRALETYLCYCVNKVLKLVLRKSTISFEWNSLPSKMKCCFHCTDLQTNGKTCSYLTRIGLYCVERVCSIPGPVRGPVVHFPLPRKEKHNTCNYEAI